MANEANDNTKTITKTETVEVIDAPGMTNAGVKSLSSMFDKIAEGKEEGKTAQEVVAAQPKVLDKPEEVAEDKKEEKVVEEKKEEVSDLSKKLDATQQKKDDPEGEITREALRKATEEQKKEDKKEEVKKEDKPEDEVPEDELKVLPSDKPKTAKRIQSLLRKIEITNAEVAKTKTEAAEKATKLAELEKKLSEVKTVDPATDEKIKVQLDELAMLRRRYELDRDPEVKTKFDARVESAEASIIDTLKRRNAGKALLDLIAEEGGFTKFSQSNRTVEIPGADGEKENVTVATLADRILQALPLADRKAVESAMMEQIQTKRDRERYFKEEQDKAVQYFKARDENAQKQTQESQKQVEEAKKAIDEFAAKTLQSDWIKDKEIPANATPQEKASAEEHNAYNAKLRGLFNKNLSAKTLPDLLGMVEDSVRYYDERRAANNLRKEVDRLKSELQAKQLEINKFKGGARSVPKTGSIATSQTTSSENGQDSMPKSISEAFDRIQRHGRVTVNADTEE